MHIICSKHYPHLMLEVFVFKTVISTGRFHDVCLCEFGLRHVQALLLNRSAHHWKNKISSTTIYNIIVEARETFTDGTFEVYFES